MRAPELVATCWTTAGDAAPMRSSERSPFNALDRVRAAAQTGWSGIGFVLDDLREVRNTIGYERLAAEIKTERLRHVEIELCSGWWRTDDVWRVHWGELLEAADALGAAFIKIGTDSAPQVDDLDPFVAPLRQLAEEAQNHGTRVALEPLPFGMIGTIPQGADLVRLAGHPAAGLIVDYWHVFRADTELDELRESLSAEMVFGVELCDAADEIVGTLFEDTRDNRKLIGHGEQDVSGFVATMREVGFTGPWGVEILSNAHRQLPLRDALVEAHRSALSVLG